MELTPLRDINSSFCCVTVASGLTGVRLHTGPAGGTMRPLCKLMQSRCSHGQHEDDADRQGRENDQNPICKTDHGCTCLVEKTG
jgi:hypothetical protein